jgi:hypothetical protein
VISPDIILPGTSALPIWNWNWNWNCGADQSAAEKSKTELPSQYHPGAAQYQPINVNISIRAWSPGNDGPVSQTNIAHTTAAIVASALPVFSPIFRPTPGSSSAASPSSPGPAPTTGAESLAEVLIELTAAVTAVPLELAVDLTCCTAALAPFVDTAGEDGAIGGFAEGATIGSPANGAPFRSASSIEPGDITAAAGAIASGAPVAAEFAALAVPRPKAEAARRAETHERLTKHVKHRAAPANERFVALTFGGATPLAPPDKDFKILLLFLLPFVFALAAAARRVEDEDRAAAAEPGRPEGRPG